MRGIQLACPFDGACFGHAMNKRTQYVINDDKVSKDLGPVTVKSTQTSLQLTSHGQKSMVC
jgi:hypothetical protein